MNIKLLVSLLFALLATVRPDDADNGGDEEDDDDDDENDGDGDGEDDDDVNDDTNDSDGDDGENDEGVDELAKWNFMMRQCSKSCSFAIEKVKNKNYRKDDSFCENEASRKWSTCWLQRIGALKDYNFDEKFVASKVKENHKPKLKICAREILKKDKKLIGCTILECFKRFKITHKNEPTQYVKKEKKKGI